MESRVYMASIFVCIIISTLLCAGLVYAASPVISVTLLNQDPNPARAGDTVNLRFKIENLGGKALSSLKFEMIQSYPFSLASGSALKTFENIEGYQADENYVTMEYTIKIDKDVVQGQRQIMFRYEYDNSDMWVTVGFSVNIVNKEFAQIIYVDKAKLDPGKETDMKFTIHNIGNAPLQNMVFSWQEPNGAILPVYSGDTKYIKYIDIGESVELEYKVVADVNAKPGLYQLNLNLKSESMTNSTTNVISTKAGVFIGGEADFDVAFSESSQGQTSLSISNTGNNPAQSVSVKIPSQQYYSVSGTNSAIIGNLDRGDYTIVSFQIAASSFNASSRRQFQQQGMPNSTMTRPSQGNVSNYGPNNLVVVIDYTDTTGDRRSVEKAVPIQFRASGIGTSFSARTANGRSVLSSGFVGSTSFWVIVIILAVAGFFVFRDKARRDKTLYYLNKFFGKKR